MKISVNDKELFTISETQKKVMCNDIFSNELDKDLKRRLSYSLVHKYDQCFDRLKKEWEPKLIARGVKSLPTDKNEFAQLVFSQADYKDRKDRETK